MSGNPEHLARERGEHLARELHAFLARELASEREVGIALLAAYDYLARHTLMLRAPAREAFTASRLKTAPERDPDDRP
jgi:hypothetical protein